MVLSVEARLCQILTFHSPYIQEISPFNNRGKEE